MEAYCARQGLEMSTICFLFDGMRVCETKTPAELNMEDDDVIDERDDDDEEDANVPLHGAVIGAGEVLEGEGQHVQDTPRADR
jgi:small ubiquitin-related modifier